MGQIEELEEDQELCAACNIKIGKKCTNCYQVSYCWYVTYLNNQKNEAHTTYNFLRLSTFEMTQQCLSITQH